MPAAVTRFRTGPRKYTMALASNRNQSKVKPMAYVLRFVQRFQPSKEKEFLALERALLEAWTEIYEVLEP
jgi:hypothetical protein